MPNRDWDALDKVMDRRRQELRLLWRDVAERAQLSSQGLYDIRAGRRTPRAITTSRIEQALGWRQGSIDAVLAGGSPELEQPDEDPGGADERGLRIGERLSWTLIDATRVEYRLATRDGSGAMMVAAADTPEEQVVEWLRADVERARRVRRE